MYTPYHNADEEDYALGRNQSTPATSNFLSSAKDRQTNKQTCTKNCGANHSPRATVQSVLRPLIKLRTMWDGPTIRPVPGSDGHVGRVLMFENKAQKGQPFHAKARHIPTKKMRENKREKKEKQKRQQKKKEEKKTQGEKEDAFLSSCLLGSGSIASEQRKAPQPGRRLARNSPSRVRRGSFWSRNWEPARPPPIFPPQLCVRPQGASSLQFWGERIFPQKWCFGLKGVSSHH